ncbi:MAG: hypothetical protein ACK5N8_00135 [Alphaproteobacteria bacterium]
MQHNFEKHDFAGNLNKLRESFYSLGMEPVEKISDDFLKTLEAEKESKILRKEKENTVRL